MDKYDVIIVGGGPAGLSAALTLGLARRRVAIFDSKSPRNAPSRRAHGLLSRDGIHPSELLRIAKQQMISYQSVNFHDASVEEITLYESFKWS